VTRGAAARAVTRGAAAAAGALSTGAETARGDVISTGNASSDTCEGDDDAVEEREAAVVVAPAAEPPASDAGIGHGATVPCGVGDAAPITVGRSGGSGVLVCIAQRPTETIAPMVALSAAVASIGLQRLGGRRAGGGGGTVARATGGGTVLSIIMRGSGSGGGGGRIVVAYGRRSDAGGGGGSD
jgi:hypothetical protein